MELLAISSSIEPMGAHFFVGILGQMWLWISVLSQAVRGDTAGGSKPVSAPQRDEHDPV